MEGPGGAMLAGTVSTLIFASSNIPMLVKAYRTQDLKSYSPLYLLLSNFGNLIHWFYIVSLPFGPIWFLHAFFTIACLLMAIWYIRYEGVISLSALKEEIIGPAIERVWRRMALAASLARSEGQACLCCGPCRCMQLCPC